MIIQPIDILGLKNFRVFDDSTGMFAEMSSINILTGANNSGKSSIIKSLQMLKNSMKGDLNPFDLDLNEQEHLLGDFENILNNKSNKDICITLPFTFLGLTMKISLTFTLLPSDNYKAKLRKIEVVDNSDNTTLFGFYYRNATDSEKAADTEEYLQHLKDIEDKQEESADPELWYIGSFQSYSGENELSGYVEWTINEDKLKNYLNYILSFYKIFYNKGDKKRVKNGDSFIEENSVSFDRSSFISSFRNILNVKLWEDYIENKLGNGVKTGKAKIGDRDFERDEFFFPVREIEDVFYEKSLEILNNNLRWIDEDEKKAPFNVLVQSFKNSWKVLTERILSINYISTIREENARVYKSSSNSPFVRLLRGFKEMEPDQIDFINKYLVAFEIGIEIEVDIKVSHQLISVAIVRSDGTKRDLVDFGYGIKQLILILIQISTLARKNRRMRETYSDEEGPDWEEYYHPSLLLIEEPETNLHPKWQSLLAKMFLEANKKFNIQFIIESHSEYMIRKFQTLVASNKVRGNEIKIFYLRDVSNVSIGKGQMESMIIQDDGSINYQMFDKGFFDEADDLELSLLNVRRNNFISDFNNLKEGEIANEAKILELEDKIDEYVLKGDITMYEQIIENRFDTSVLLDSTVNYLASGQFLLHQIQGQCDFSPVVIQYGRALENELKQIFTVVNPQKKWMLGIMQGTLEKLINGNTALATCGAQEMLDLQSILLNDFDNHADLKVDLIEDLRNVRNTAGHAGSIISESNARLYILKINEFFDEWIAQKS